MVADLGLLPEARFLRQSEYLAETPVTRRQLNYSIHRFGRFRGKESFASMGRFDVADIAESDDPKQVEKAAMIIRAYGHSTTETLGARPWKEFLEML